MGKEIPERTNTDFGVAFSCKRPGRILDEMANGGDDNAVDVVMQCGAFGGLIFG